MLAESREVSCELHTYRDLEDGLKNLALRHFVRVYLFLSFPWHASTAGATVPRLIWCGTLAGDGDGSCKGE